MHFSLEEVMCLYFMTNFSRTLHVVARTVLGWAHLFKQAYSLWEHFVVTNWTEHIWSIPTDNYWYRFKFVHFVCLCASTMPDWPVNGGIMFSGCPFICPFTHSFVCYQTCEHVILITKEPVLMLNGPRGKGVKWERQQSRSYTAEMCHKLPLQSDFYPSNFNETLQAHFNYCKCLSTSGMQKVSDNKPAYETLGDLIK